MREAQARIEDSRLDVERRLKYQGTAQIRLEALYFQKNRHRPVEKKHVEFIKRGLKARILDAALQATKICGTRLLSNHPDGCPELQLPHGEQLECLHGQHRIQAGREFLRPTEHWWTVDLYLADVNTDLKTCLVEEYSNEEKPSDGELFCKIRHYHFLPDHSLEMRWEARLRGNRLKNYTSLKRHRDLLQSFDALRDIPGLWNGMKITTLHTIVAMNCNELLTKYLGDIKDFYTHLVGADFRALRRIDAHTVRAIESRAPFASTFDAETLQGQILGGEIFSAFSDEERRMVWARLQLTKGMIPSLFTFFRDVLYLRECTDCIKRLTTPSSREGLFIALERNYTGFNQREDLVIEQLAENIFTNRPGTERDRIDLGVRHLVAFAMRELYQMPREPEGKNNRMRATVMANKAVLRRFADLAERLGFESAKISAMKHHPSSFVVEHDIEQPSPLLVTSGPGVAYPQRCGPPRSREYEEDRKNIFVQHLHSPEEDRGQGITSFFVLKHIYLKFFGKPKTSNPEHIDSATETYEPMDQDSLQSDTEAQRAGVERAAAERIEAMRLESQRLEAESVRAEIAVRAESERLKTGRIEAERIEAGRIEAERLEAGRIEAERIEAERLEAGRIEAERIEAERIEAERLEAGRIEAERIEAERIEAERLEAGRIEAERIEAERIEAGRIEAERLEAGRIEAERIEAGRIEAGRIEAERLEAERIEAGRIEAERIEAERIEAERIEAERVEAERIEAERIEAERVEAERMEVEKLKRRANRITQFDLEHLQLSEESSSRPRLEDHNQITSPATENIAEGQGGPLHPSQTGNSGADLSSSTLISQQIQTPTTSTIHQSTTRPSNDQNLIDDKIRIEFKVKQRGVWTTDRPLIVPRSDPSEVERIATKYLRKKFRLLNSRGSGLNPKDCFDMVTEDGTNTILLIPNEEKDITDELTQSGSEALRDMTEDHPPKKQARNKHGT